MPSPETCLDKYWEACYSQARLRVNYKNELDHFVVHHDRQNSCSKSCMARQKYKTRDLAAVFSDYIDTTRRNQRSLRDCVIKCNKRLESMSESEYVLNNLPADAFDDDEPDNSNNSAASVAMASSVPKKRAYHSHNPDGHKLKLDSFSGAQTLDHHDTVILPFLEAHIVTHIEDPKYKFETEMISESDEDTATRAPLDWQKCLEDTFSFRWFPKPDYLTPLGSTNLDEPLARQGSEALDEPLEIAPTKEPEAEESGEEEEEEPESEEPDVGLETQPFEEVPTTEIPDEDENVEEEEESVDLEGEGEEDLANLEAEVEAELQEAQSSAPYAKAAYHRINADDTADAFDDDYSSDSDNDSFAHSAYPHKTLPMVFSEYIVDADEKVSKKAFSSIKPFDQWARSKYPDLDLDPKKPIDRVNHAQNWYANAKREQHSVPHFLHGVQRNLLADSDDQYARLARASQYLLKRNPAPLRSRTAPHLLEALDAETGYSEALWGSKKRQRKRILKQRKKKVKEAREFFKQESKRSSTDQILEAQRASMSQYYAAAAMCSGCNPTVEEPTCRACGKMTGHTLFDFLGFGIHHDWEASSTDEGESASSTEESDSGSSEDDESYSEAKGFKKAKKARKGREGALKSRIKSASTVRELDSISTEVLNSSLNKRKKNKLYKLIGKRRDEVKSQDRVLERTEDLSIFTEAVYSSESDCEEDIEPSTRWQQTSARAFFEHPFSSQPAKAKFYENGTLPTEYLEYAHQSMRRANRGELNKVENFDQWLERSKGAKHPAAPLDPKNAFVHWYASAPAFRRNMDGLLNDPYMDYAAAIFTPSKAEKALRFRKISKTIKAIDKLMPKIHRLKKEQDNLELELSKLESSQPNPEGAKELAEKAKKCEESQKPLKDEIAELTSDIVKLRTSLKAATASSQMSQTYASALIPIKWDPVAQNSAKRQVASDLSALKNRKKVSRSDIKSLATSANIILEAEKTTFEQFKANIDSLKRKIAKLKTIIKTAGPTRKKNTKIIKECPATKKKLRSKKERLTKLKAKLESQQSKKAKARYTVVFAQGATKREADDNARLASANIVSSCYRKYVQECEHMRSQGPNNLFKTVPFHEWMAREYPNARWDAGSLTHPYLGWATATAERRNGSTAESFYKTRESVQNLIEYTGRSRLANGELQSTLSAVSWKDSFKKVPSYFKKIARTVTPIGVPFPSGPNMKVNDVVRDVQYLLQKDQRTLKGTFVVEAARRVRAYSKNMLQVWRDRFYNPMDTRGARGFKSYGRRLVTGLVPSSTLLRDANEFLARNPFTVDEQKTYSPNAELTAISLENLLTMFEDEKRDMSALKWEPVFLNDDFKRVIAFLGTLHKNPSYVNMLSLAILPTEGQLKTITPDEFATPTRKAVFDEIQTSLLRALFKDVTGGTVETVELVNRYSLNISKVVSMPEVKRFINKTPENSRKYKDPYARTAISPRVDDKYLSSSKRFAHYLTHYLMRFEMPEGKPLGGRSFEDFAHDDMKPMMMVFWIIVHVQTLAKTRSTSFFASTQAPRNNEPVGEDLFTLSSANSNSRTFTPQKLPNVSHLDLNAQIKLYEAFGRALQSRDLDAGLTHLSENPEVMALLSAHIPKMTSSLSRAMKR